jgi:hypothetical protein
MADPILSRFRLALVAAMLALPLAACDDGAEVGGGDSPATVPPAAGDSDGEPTPIVPQRDENLTPSPPPATAD